jgi:large subunit ribosomal protein L4
MAEKKGKSAKAEPAKAESKVEAKAEARADRAEERAEAKAEERAEVKAEAAKAESKPEPKAKKAKATKADPTAVAVVNAENKKVRDITLAAEVFAVKVNQHLLYEAVKQYRAKGRRGTHMTKNRALVSGTGKKPWRQKGTGRARAGEARNPLWRHGGTVFGPVPRDYGYAMPKKARAAALRSALAQRAAEGALQIVEAFPVDTPKTKVLMGILGKLGVKGKAVLVDHEPTDALVLSGRNIPNLKVLADTHLTAYDVLDCKHLLLSQEALTKLEERLTP